MHYVWRKRCLSGWVVVLTTGVMALIGLFLLTSNPTQSVAAPSSPHAPTADAYIVLAWNDLGMHCYNRDFEYLAVLPPYNTLWAQVIRLGDPPEIVTSGVTVTYHFADNTYAVGKSNFWDYAQDLFGVDLAPNIGLTGKGMTGTLDIHGMSFVAEGIPLTEFRDSDYEANPANPTPYPYQLATVTVWDAVSGAKLAETVTVAPASTEMHCDTCHFDGNIEDIATGNVELNILTLHDMENSDEYPPGHTGALVNRTPILCAECHASNALGAAGQPGVPNLSRAIHKKHKDEVPSTLSGCYQCHPGPQTQCLRDVMSQAGMECVDCHGTMEQVKDNPDPWLNEPRCDDSGCHDSGDYAQDQALYRLSVGHGDVYCAGCHDSPHAVAPSREPNDALKFLALQGANGPLGDAAHCTVCHAAMPLGEGPHGLEMSEIRAFTFAPNYMTHQSPGVTVVYTHTLQNTGNVSDTYELTWTSSQGWAEVLLRVDGSVIAFPMTLLLPVTLNPGISAQVEVTVSVPNSDAVRGLRDTTIVTATSLLGTSLVDTVVDTTYVAATLVYLPLVIRQ